LTSGTVDTESVRLNFIQALRGVAATSVVLWHGSRYLAPYGTGVSGWFEPGAAMGVSLFFLISGFIMVHTTRRSDDSLHAFWRFTIKRVTRIWPVWLAALACYCLLLKHRMPILEDSAQLKWLLGSIALVPVPGFPPGVPPAWDYPVLGVGWTLNYEVYFYGFFALSLLWGRWRWWAFTGWLIATLILSPMLVGTALTPLARWSPSSDLGFSVSYLRLITNPIILLFAVGSGIGLLYSATSLRIANPRVATAFVLSTMVLVILQWVTHFRIGHGVAEWGLSLIPLMMVFCLASKSIRMPAPTWLIWLGNVSFSLYLFHPLMQEGFDTQSWRLPWAALRTGFPALLLTTVLSLLAAAVSYRTLERGVCTWLQAKLLPANPPSTRLESATARSSAPGKSEGQC
jgi:exopolysaccharide production protein ExoZ